MKNGIFKALSALSLGLLFLQLSGCATLFDLGDEEEGELDRGYTAEEQYDADDACRGLNCHTEADGPGRSLASVAEDEESPGVGHPYDNRIQHAIETRDVILGMTRQDVMQSWGEPNQREVAGRGSSGHERWTYGSRYSLGESRTIIFENGKVAGWHR